MSLDIDYSDLDSVIKSLNDCKREYSGKYISLETRIVDDYGSPYVYLYGYREENDKEYRERLKMRERYEKEALDRARKLLKDAGEI